VTYKTLPFSPGVHQTAFIPSSLALKPVSFLSEHGIVCMDVGAGCMHIVAVSGVLYLFLGFFRIARKPVN
jgi:hypothetical protein